jgi:predicted GNAT family N-acyltransferase
MGFAVFGVEDREAMKTAIDLRVEVFVDEQRVPIAEEVDEHDRDDPGAVHVLYFDGDEAIATGRLYASDDSTAKIGRLVVRKSRRGAGIGAGVLDRLIAEARARGFRRVALSAQTAACGFYERFGFERVGATYLEVGIEHQEMVRLL